MKVFFLNVLHPPPPDLCRIELFVGIEGMIAIDADGPLRSRKIGEMR
jgi:hypothetical protein